jgi:hypothetical protein
MQKELEEDQKAMDLKEQQKKQAAESEKTVT